MPSGAPCSAEARQRRRDDVADSRQIGRLTGSRARQRRRGPQRSSRSEFRERVLGWKPYRLGGKRENNRQHRSNWLPDLDLPSFRPLSIPCIPCRWERFQQPNASRGLHDLLRFLERPAVEPHEFIPTSGRLLIPPADGMRVNVCRHPNRGVAQALRYGRQIHTIRQQERSGVWRSVCRLAPLGRPRRRQSRDTAAETESGFSGVPSGLAKIKSRSER